MRVEEYQLLNDACLMNQAKVINQLKQTPRGDREIVFERAQALGRKGLNLQPLLTCLKATLTSSNNDSTFGKKQQCIKAY